MIPYRKTDFMQNHDLSSDSRLNSEFITNHHTELEDRLQQGQPRSGPTAYNLLDKAGSAL